MEKIVVSSKEGQGLARAVGWDLELEVYTTTLTRFANGETKPVVPDVKDKHVYLWENMTLPSPNEAVMETALTMDALVRNGASGITLIAPFMPYMRQDRVDEKGAPLSARVVANILESCNKLEKIITVDAHVEQAQGFYNVPLVNLSAHEVFAQYFQDKENPVVVSPDYGGVKRAKKLAKLLHAPLAVMDKERIGVNKVQCGGILGCNVEGKTAILYDDMIDTGGSIIAAANQLKEAGAKEVYAAATHGLFTKREEFVQSGVFAVVANTIPGLYHHKDEPTWFRQLDINDLIKEELQ